ncbi:MAG: amino acid adenylation domain-containing protein, partial [Gammaproteobacteria bacterium]|nr:amino acid adenylation domain-containing protein [Gammaproteobacteria bacterium]
MEIEDIYPLSPAQEGMLFHDACSPDARLYVERLRYCVTGALDADAFERAWQTLVRRHAALRSAFLWENLDTPLQAVLSRVDITLDRHDCRGLDPAEAAALAERSLAEWNDGGFDLSRPPLLRLSLIRTKDDEYEFLWAYHHLLLDGWSVGLLLAELIEIYEAASAGREPQLETRRPYRDYIAWLQQKAPAEAEAHWREALAGFTTPVLVDLGRPRPSQAAGASPVERIRVPAETAARLHDFARSRRLTLNTLIQAAWAILLCRYSGQRDVVFGAVASGRPAELAGSDAMIGMFINTLPVRVQVQPDRPLIDWLHRLQDRQVEARRFEHAPLSKIQGWSSVPKGARLFDSIVVFENPSMGVRLSGSRGLAEIRDARHVPTATGYPLTLVVEPAADRLDLTLTFDETRYDAPAARRALEGLVRALDGVVTQQRVGDVTALDDAERRRILVHGRGADADVPADVRLDAPFERHARHAPDAIALEHGTDQISYGELELRSSRLAERLRYAGVGPEARVGICLERSPDLIVAILAVLKAGAAWLPLDPDYPVARLRYMLGDAAVAALVARRDTARRLGPDDGIGGAARGFDVVGDDAPILLEVGSGDTAAPGNHRPGSETTRAAGAARIAARGAGAQRGDDGRPGADNAAYVIYTSGSTGEPKGVVVTHGAICNHMQWLARELRLSAEDRWLLKTPSSFDASINEVFGALSSGARLVIADPGGHRDPSYLAGTIAERRITVYQSVPTLLRFLLAEPRIAQCDSLRAVISAGEALDPELKDRAHAHLAADLYNLYGPTEAAIDATSWRCRRPLPSSGTVAEISSVERAGAPPGTVPIGRPIANARAYVLGPDLEPMPAGAAGELCIGGAGLARGYIGRPELTAERFVPDPFDRPGGGRLYRTGDLARFDGDGLLEHAGRLDEQVKLRGFRIELGEIEACLNAHPAVVESAAAIRPDGAGRPRLAAYVVARASARGGHEAADPVRDVERAEAPGDLARADSRAALALAEARGDTERAAERSGDGAERADAPGSDAELREFARARLPEHMLPALWFRVDALPRAPNGKLDRRRLAELDARAAEPAARHVPPADGVEGALAALWAEVLEVPEVGIRDNFFELGGDSILALQLVGRAAQRGLKLTPRD